MQIIAHPPLFLHHFLQKTKVTRHYGIIPRLVRGERVMLSCATFQPNSTVPTHSHTHEQTGIIVEGELELTVGNESRICRKGDAFTIPGNTEHNAASGDTATTIIDTFSPPREDYM